MILKLRQILDEMKMKFFTIFLIGLGCMVHYQDSFGQCATPTNLSTTNVQANSADLSWDAVSGARRYRVKYRPVGNSSWSTIRTRSTSITIQNLVSGITYEWKVKTHCRGQSSSYAPIVNFTTTSNCPVPTPFTPLGVGSHQATLVWLNLNSQVNGYNVRWREVGSGVWNFAMGIPTNLYIVEGLDPLTTYEYGVQSDCGGSSSAYSGSVQWTTPENVCTDPKGYQVTGIGTDFVSLAWQAVGGTEHYRVRYREIGSPIWLFKDFIGGTSTTIGNLFPNTTYESQVQSECTLGATDWSSLITFTTLQIGSCDAPQNLFASMITASSAKHNWNPVVGALSYTMRRRVAGTQPWSNFSTTETSITTFLLASGTTYEFQVQTHCTIGDSPFSPSSFYTTQGDPPCPAATNLTVDDITPTSADFDWDDVVGALHYRFEWRIQGSTSWSSVQTTSSHIARTGLVPATTYEWRVGSLCTSGGTYTFTTIHTFMTAQPGQCTTPTGLFVLGVSQTQATLLWSSIPEANDYDARIRETGTATWDNFTGITTNLKVVLGLSSSTEYEWQVRANCSSQSSPYSASDVFTTQPASDIRQAQNLTEISSTSARDQEIRLRLYPNPTSENVSLDGVDIQAIVIYNSMGRPVASRQFSEPVSSITLNLRELNLRAGMHTIGVESVGGIIDFQPLVMVGMR